MTPDDSYEAPFQTDEADQQEIEPADHDDAAMLEDASELERSSPSLGRLPIGPGIR